MKKKAAIGIGGRLKALAQRHAQLEAVAQQEHARPAPDMIELTRLKRAKLRLKDEMAILEGLRRTLDRPVSA